MWWWRVPWGTESALSLLLKICSTSATSWLGHRLRTSGPRFYSGSGCASIVLLGNLFPLRCPQASKQAHFAERTSGARLLRFEEVHCPGFLAEVCAFGIWLAPCALSLSTSLL